MLIQFFIISWIRIFSSSSTRQYIP